MAMTLRLTAEEDELLTQTAAAEGRSKQDVARAAIVEYVRRREHVARRDAEVGRIIAEDRSLLDRLAE